MTQEEKNILVKELCMRMPYGVKCNINGELCKVTRVDVEYQQVYLKKDNEHGGTYSIARGDVLKPYLRPMSSMTKEEYESIKKEFLFFGGSICNISDMYTSVDVVDWLNSHHFDYRELIEKGLALVAPEDMYQDIVL